MLLIKFDALLNGTNFKRSHRPETGDFDQTYLALDPKSVGVSTGKL